MEVNREFYQWKRYKRVDILFLLTIFQDRNVGDVTLVCLVFRGHWRKFNVTRVEDGGESAVDTTQLLQQ